LDKEWFKRIDVIPEKILLPLLYIKPAVMKQNRISVFGSFVNQFPNVSEFIKMLFCGRNVTKIPWM
jgi:hypothetical protein